MTSFTSHMALALDAAHVAASRGEVPVGAAVIDPETGAAIATAGNEMRARRDPTAHAEILAIRAACAARGTERLTGLDLYVTLEPCPMCAGAIAAARLRRLYYGAEDPKSGGVDHGPRVFAHPTCHHAPEVYSGLAAADSARLLTDFFASRR